MDSLPDELAQAMQPIILGQIRHAIAGFGVWMTTVGAIRSDQESAFVDIWMGIVLYLGAAAWSALQKRVIPQLQARIKQVQKSPKAANGPNA